MPEAEDGLSERSRAAGGINGSSELTVEKEGRPELLLWGALNQDVHEGARQWPAKPAEHARAVRGEGADLQVVGAGGEASGCCWRCCCCVGVKPGMGRNGSGGCRGCWRLGAPMEREQPSRHQVELSLQETASSQAQLSSGYKVPLVLGREWRRHGGDDGLGEMGAGG